MTESALPCGNCGCSKIRLQRKSGMTGRTPISRTRFYRETITCSNCGIFVQAKTPGKGLQFWNQSSQHRTSAKREQHAES